MTLSHIRPFGAAVDTAILAHANDDRRHEICGVVASDGGGKGPTYHRVPNRAATPRTAFVIDPQSLTGVGRVLAVVHSHPQGPPWPSSDDLRQSQADDLAWGIVLPKGQPHAGLFWFGGPVTMPLMTRGYRHGVSDCYALVRDWFAATYGLGLIDRPRGWQWWQQGDDIYTDHFAQSGFVRLPADAELAIGDVALAAVLGDVINHALIHLGDGVVLHHPAGRDGFDPARLPRSEPVERWRRYIRFWARHPDVAPLPEGGG
ncbi:MAG: Mov34/MPN/PAD-1 family protein [Candidatus Puniceispirillaceae bacterium]